MKREEAITILETLWNNPLFNDSHKEALNIAIEALEHPEKNVISIVPCDNAISRQAVLDIINFEDKWLLDAKGHNADTEIAFGGMKSKVSDLPSVTPQQMTGRWINSRVPESTLCECSVCGFTCGAYSFNYCPDCGAKMVEPQESEDKR